jgi:hypothetical protein
MASDGKKYHADEMAAAWALARASDEQLQKWGTDPDCIEMDVCAKALRERLANRETDRARLQTTLAAKRKELQDNPFDPRTEVSADTRHIARKIVMHMWILFAVTFVLLPFLIAVVLVMVGVIK